MTEAVAEIADLSDESLERIAALSGGAEAAEQRIVSGLNLLMELDIPDKVIRIAKVGHMVWRRRLATMAIGREALQPDELADNHSCRLGKWYDQADQSYRSRPAYDELNLPHELVHQHGIAAARAYQAGDIDGALEAIRAVADASVDVMRLLEELIDREALPAD